jgi:acyl carrier protein
MAEERRRNVMTTATEINQKSRWSADEIEVVLLDLLGELLNEDVDELRRRLLEQGPTMPVDSLDVFDVLADFRRVTGLRVPLRKLRRNTMRSVKTLSEFVEKEGQQ